MEHALAAWRYSDAMRMPPRWLSASEDVSGWGFRQATLGDCRRGRCVAAPGFCHAAGRYVMLEPVSVRVRPRCEIVSGAMSGWCVDHAMLADLLRGDFRMMARFGCGRGGGLAELLGDGIRLSLH